MPVMTIKLDADGCLNDVSPDNVIHIASPITVGALAHGMESGAPSVAFIFKLPDGRTVLAETSMKLFQMAAEGFAARYGWVNHL
jgi:hypothetical protein